MAEACVPGQGGQSALGYHDAVRRRAGLET
jgi:hypothetical protein